MIYRRPCLWWCSHDLQGDMRTPQGVQTRGRYWKILFWADAMPGLPDFHQMGRIVVSVLRIQAKRKTKKCSVPQKDGLESRTPNSNVCIVLAFHGIGWLSAPFDTNPYIFECRSYIQCQKTKEEMKRIRLLQEAQRA